jgi:hypothetical protein
MEYSITCIINCDYTIAATLCTVVYMVCFRYVIVNTLHTGGCGGGYGDDDNTNVPRTKIYAKGETAL